MNEAYFVYNRLKWGLKLITSFLIYLFISSSNTDPFKSDKYNFIYDIIPYSYLESD
jgi:hypothetical protein